MIDIHYIVAPLLGGLIGYITNDIAIKMLFHPHTEKRIFGWRVPFTPGLIPKEKGRIAASIGNVISENLLDKETLGKYLLSDEMLCKLRSSINEVIEKQKHNEETLESLLSRYLTEIEMQSVKRSVNDSLTGQISLKLMDPAIGQAVARMAMDHVAGKLNGEGAQILLGGIGGAMGGLGGLFKGGLIGNFLGMLREPAERFLANNINDMLRSNGHKMVSGMLDGEVDSFLHKRVCDLLAGREELLEKIPAKVEAIYRTAITEHLPKILGSINISKLVSDRINEMNVVETEQLIFKIMNKELRAIVWLGAGLGLIMGGLNCLIP